MAALRKKIEPPNWKGRTVVCIASGPSLTAEDCEAVRHLPAITVNSSFTAAPWAECLFAHDTRWWTHYEKQVKQGHWQPFAGRKMTLHDRRAESLYNCGWFPQAGNSGTCAIYIAIAAQASRVILLGFDCMKDGDKTHWHPDHPTPMSNALSIKAWPKQFEKVAAHANRHGVEVLNASRRTALTCFPRVSLGAVL